MFFWKPQDVRPPSAGVPSPLLDFIAGEHAGRIAGLWPEPHAVFLTAPAARRHLVCIALARAGPQDPIDAEAILHRSLRRAVALAVPAAPPGLGRALERLGERAWSGGDYLALLRLLAGRQSGKILRHREHIAAGEVRALDRLPRALVEQGLGALGLGESAAGLIAEAFGAIAARDGEAAALALVPRWGAAGGIKGLAERVQLDLEPEVAAPPFAGTDRLRPLAAKAELIDAASRYKNCLRNHVYRASAGTSAFYEWAGPPGVVLEITRDRLYGWALDQARLAGNDAVPEPARTEIAQDLRALGVHVGRSFWHLDNALDDIAATPPRPVQTEAAVIGELFGD